MLSDGNIYIVSRYRNNVTVKKDNDSSFKISFNVSYSKLKRAMVNSSLRRLFIQDFNAISDNPKLEKLLYEIYKNNDEFKLSSEF